MAKQMMTMPAVFFSLLRLRLFLMKSSWLNGLIVLLVLLAPAVYFIAIPYAEQRLRTEQQKLVEIERARDAAAVPLPLTPRATNDERLARFYQALGERNYAEQQVATLFAIAGKTNLALQQADYKWMQDRAGRFTTYRIQLPLKGSYGAIQQFCEQVLLAIPFASLDQLSFKRDTIGNNVIEAQLNFTFYLSGQAAVHPVQLGQEMDE